MLAAEFRSHIRWNAVERGDDHPKPLVLYFEDDVPQGLTESGLYVCYSDFMDVRREMRWTPESLANLFHTLVLFMAEADPRMHQHAEEQLRYNPSNRASWNEAAYTYDYHLLIEGLTPYSPDRVSPDYKIPGVGRLGRRVLRAVLYDQISDEMEAIPAAVLDK